MIADRERKCLLWNLLEISIEFFSKTVNAPPGKPGLGQHSSVNPLAQKGHATQTSSTPTNHLLFHPPPYPPSHLILNKPPRPPSLRPSISGILKYTSPAPHPKHFVPFSNLHISICMCDPPYFFVLVVSLKGRGIDLLVIAAAGIERQGLLVDYSCVWLVEWGLGAVKGTICEMCITCGVGVAWISVDEGAQADPWRSHR